MDEASFLYFMDHSEISLDYTQTGCTILYNAPQNQLILMKQIDLNEDDNVHDMIDILHKQKQLYHEHLLSLIDFYPAFSEGKMIKFYEYCSHTLLQEIQSRMESDNHFSEEELENILVSGLKLLQYLEQSQIGHGCISPLDICITDDVVKVVDPSIASSNPLSISEGYYYSPELMESIVRNQEQDIDIFKNDIFSLAMCVLHCGLLNSCHDCYDYEAGGLIFEELEEKISQFNEMYSPRLVNVLIRMLDEDSSTRPTSTQTLLLIEREFQQDAQKQQQFQNQNQDDVYNQSQYEQAQYMDVHYQDCGYGGLSKKQSLESKQNKLKSSENNPSLLNISKTEQRLASMINRAKMNISKIKQKSAIKQS